MSVRRGFFLIVDVSCHPHDTARPQPRLSSIAVRLNPWTTPQRRRLHSGCGLGLKARRFRDSRVVRNQQCTEHRCRRRGQDGFVPGDRQNRKKGEKRITNRLIRGWHQSIGLSRN